MRGYVTFRSHLPELQRLRERHTHDRERLQRELQEYYRRHGINPLAAAVPMLVQIPIFVSLYVLLRQDVSGKLFGDAGFLFVTQQPQGRALLVLVVAYLSTAVQESVTTTYAGEWTSWRRPGSSSSTTTSVAVAARRSATPTA